ncbi:MAG: FitA-like ribbon-helix-helix domain-containing protein [Gemmatimonadota bacterium]
MPTLTIKGLPQPLYRRLKQQAAAHRRSLNGEIIVCLERAVGASQADPGEWLAAARGFRERVRLRPLSERQLRVAREAGRA